MRSLGYLLHEVFTTFPLSTIYLFYLSVSCIIHVYGRFHILQEFDEGKRSCRRRLAGHNRRRRKTHPDGVANGGSLNDERGSSYLLMSLLRILSNVHCEYSCRWKFI